MCVSEGRLCVLVREGILYSNEKVGYMHPVWRGSVGKTA